jgi:hypothetical protein
MRLPLANGKYRKPANTVAMLLAWSGLVVWLFHAYVYFQYDSTRPRTPDVASGRVIEQSNHGRIVYLTAAEHTRLIRITILALGLFVSGFVIRGLFDPDGFFNRKPKAWEVRRW